MTKMSGWCYLHFVDDFGKKHRVRTFLIRETDAQVTAQNRNWELKRIDWD